MKQSEFDALSRISKHLKESGALNDDRMTLDNILFETEDRELIIPDDVESDLQEKEASYLNQYGDKIEVIDGKHIYQPNI